MALLLESEAPAVPAGYYAGARQRVHFGPGSIRNLADVLAGFDARRVLVVTTVPNFAVVDAVRAAVRPAEVVAVYDGVTPHAPRQESRDAFRRLQESRADSVISVGGGSAADAARGVLILAATGQDFNDMRVSLGFPGFPAGKVVEMPVDRVLPFLTVSTTLSQAEFNVITGITDEATGLKEIYYNESLLPPYAFLDGEAALHTPDRLWVGTGIKAMETAIIRFLTYRGPQWALDPMLLHGIRTLYRLLPVSHREPDRVDVRQQLQLACWQAFGQHMLPVDSSVPVATDLIRFGSAARHQFGGRYRAPHGELAGIVLPAVLDFNRAETEPRQRELAHALGKETPEELSRDLWPTFVSSLGLPTRLGQLGVGIDETALPSVVELMIAEQPALVERRAELTEILRGLL